jgi:hypothetical protein
VRSTLWGQLENGALSTVFVTSAAKTFHRLSIDRLDFCHMNARGGHSIALPGSLYSVRVFLGRSMSMFVLS